MTEVWLMFGALLGTIALGVPIPIAVAIATVVGYQLIDLPFVAIAQAMYTGVEPFPLLTVPLFVFAGSLMERGGLALRIVAIAQSMMGNFTGTVSVWWRCWAVRSSQHSLALVRRPRRRSVP